MNKITSLILLMMLSACATRTWTERTDETRAVGPTKQVVENRTLTDEYFDARTNLEADGYQWVDDVNTDSEGKIEIDLLPAALQCLAYDHDVKIELWSYSSNNVDYTRNINAEFAKTVIREWSVQANLGASVPLRRAEDDLLKKLISATASGEVKQHLRDIKKQVTIRFDWE